MSFAGDRSGTRFVGPESFIETSRIGAVISIFSEGLLLAKFGRQQARAACHTPHGKPNISSVR